MIRTHLPPILAAVAILAMACSQGPTGPAAGGAALPSAPFVISSPVPNPSATAPAAAGAHLVAPMTVYISLPSGTFPTGISANIQVSRTGSTATVTVLNGGFDPVAVIASVGDTVTATVTTSGTDSPITHSFTVPDASSPVVIRTDPPGNKRDVPLNANLVIVFSEPIAPTTLTTTTVQLKNGSAAVGGQLAFANGAHTTAVFQPSGLLAANTNYSVVVTSGIRDQSGEALAGNVSVQFTTGTTIAIAPVASVTLSVSSTTTPVGSTVPLSVTLKDSVGNILTGRTVTWSSSVPTVATVSATGLVTAIMAGASVVTATSEGMQGTMSILVLAPPGIGPVASVTVTPSAPILGIGGVQLLTANLLNAVGSPLTGRAVVWRSSVPSVATVGFDGTVVAVALGTTVITANSEGIEGIATISVSSTPSSRLTFASVSPAGFHTCALTTTGAAYCWGRNDYGELGDGTTTSRAVPIAVTGGHTFVQITAGHDHTCGITTTGAAFCWGLSGYGQTGSDGPRGVPAAVAGGLQFSTIGAGDEATCGVTTSAEAYCWGFGSYGQLGRDTTQAAPSCQAGLVAVCAVPSRVAADLAFAQVSPGGNVTCGQTTLGAAYCWGLNNVGQMGIGNNTGPQECTADLSDGGPPDVEAFPCGVVPAPVIGGIAFRTVVGMESGACGLSVTGQAYCWGSNRSGDLGAGATTGPQVCLVGPGGVAEPCSMMPIAVAGGFVFTHLTAAGTEACGLTNSGSAYCWGPPASPTAVPGGLSFATITAGLGPTCGLTTTGSLYCWGSNQYGELGTGSTANSGVPVKVAGQQ